MGNFRIIGVTGKARAGKDTVAEYLCSEYEFAPLSFAAPLKRMVAALLNEGEYWIDAHKDEHIPGLTSPRRLLQTLGTDWGRNIIDTNMWVNIVNREISKLDPEWYNGVVLTDCRFNNEAEWILGNGGEIWEVVRPGCDPVAEHVSENGIDPRYITHTILNDSNIDVLHQKLEGMV